MLNYMIKTGKPLSLVALFALLFFTASCDIFTPKPQEPSWSLVSEEEVVASSIVEYGALLYARGGFSSQLFSSKDSGKTWLSLGDKVPSNIVSFTVNQSGIWAASESELFRSSDNGISWVSIVKSFALRNGLTRIRSISVNGNEIFLATNWGGYFSANLGGQWRNLNITNSISDVQKIEITNSGVFAQTRGGIYFSSDRISWKIAQPDLCQSCSFRIITQNSGTIYTSTTEQGASFPISSSLYRTNNNGMSWTEIPISVTGLSRVPNIRQLKIANSSTLFLAIETYQTADSLGLNRIITSSDNGNTWRALSVLGLPKTSSAGELGLGYGYLFYQETSTSDLYRFKY